MYMYMYTALVYFTKLYKVAKYMDVNFKLTADGNSNNDALKWTVGLVLVYRNGAGLMEFAGVDKAARSKMGVWKMQDWTHRHDMARVNNAGVDNSAPCCRDGICRSGQISTMWQGWTLQEWTMRHHVAGTEFAGVDKSARCGKGGHCRSGQCGTMWQGWTMREWTMQE